MIPILDRDADIVTFVTHKKFLNLSLSPAQRALLKAIYGLELTDEDWEFWWQCTQREKYPGEPFTEVDAIFGTRGGKSSRLEAPCMLYEALMGGFEPNVGESMVVPVVAQDQAASRIVFLPSVPCGDRDRRSPERSARTGPRRKRWSSSWVRYLGSDFMTRTFAAAQTRVLGRKTAAAPTVSSGPIVGPPPR